MNCSKIALAEADMILPVQRPKVLLSFVNSGLNPMLKNARLIPHSNPAYTLSISIKRKTATTGESNTPTDDPTDGASVGKIRGKVESTKLREILSNMGSDEEY